MNDSDEVRCVNILEKERKARIGTLKGVRYLIPFNKMKGEDRV